MMDSQIKQYKQFKQDFEFSLSMEIGLLQRVARKTWNTATRAQAEESLAHLMDRRRKQSHREQTIRFSYAMYLQNFMKDRPKTFDTLLEHLEQGKLGHVDRHVLARVTRELV